MEVEPESSSSSLSLVEVAAKQERKSLRPHPVGTEVSAAKERGEPLQAGEDSSQETGNSSEEEEERKIEEEYFVWRKNAPYLYDFVNTRALDWPSLTVEWLPDARYKGRRCTEQRLIVGTHTNGAEPNYLKIVHVKIPFSGDPSESSSSSSSGISGKQVSGFSMEKCRNGVAYYEEGGSSNGNRGSGGSSQKPAAEMEIEERQRICHPSEVNRARYMPQNPSIIATKGVMPEVYVFDITKHPSNPTDTQCRPDLRLSGHKSDGYGLDWSPCREGHLASGSDDGLVCLWDISACSSSDSEAQAKSVAKFHTDIVEDVAWHRTQPNILASVGDDRKIAIWDDRSIGAPAVVIESPHGKKEINTISFNPFNPFLFATGGSDSSVALWDSRNTKVPLHVIRSHTAEVYQVEWSHAYETILASSGNDRRVIVWDVSRIGAQQTPEDAKEGPPELMFVHGGHTSRVTEFSWNPNDPWVLASVADDNVLQIWQMAETIYSL